MSWKVEFPFLVQTLQFATQIVLPRERRSQLKLHGTELILIGDLTGRLSDGWVWDYTAAPPTI